ncbi:MAG: hypothetical protein H2172_13555 [Opitutus sp.]|nr:hypothetical protein [Opitutus sp.]MCS6275713.1 hypothetical protein [Opitutus sp.]MCS6300810.1 hypothetical protein [Opitutus sp.]
MSISELKKTADSLSAKERQWLRAYLFVNERASSPEWKSEIVKKRRKLQAGMGVTANQFKRRTAGVTSVIK